MRKIENLLKSSADVFTELFFRAGGFLIRLAFLNCKKNDQHNRNVMNVDNNCVSACLPRITRMTERRPYDNFDSFQVIPIFFCCKTNVSGEVKKEIVKMEKFFLLISQYDVCCCCGSISRLTNAQ